MKKSKIKGIELPIHILCGNDPLRKAQQTVYFENGYMYATNSFVAVRASIKEFTGFSEDEIALLNGKNISSANFLKLFKCGVLIVTKNGVEDSSNGNVNKLNSKGLPDSFVPNRNQLFITLAHSYAQKVGAEALITGTCETDFSGYPDCRRVFIDAIQYASNLGSQSKIQILTPLMYLNKSQTFKLADDLGCLNEVIEESHTCYNGDREHLHEWGYGCDNCPACELRKKGFTEFKDSK